MLYSNIDLEISKALKEKRLTDLETLRSIKTEFLLYETSGKDKQIDDQVEIKILKKMSSKIKESINQFAIANRQDLIEHETQQLHFIEQYLPKEATEEEIKKTVSEAIEHIKITENRAVEMRDMKKIIAFVQERISADNKIVSSIVKEILMKK